MNLPVQVLSLKEGEAWKLKLDATGYPEPKVNCRRKNRTRNIKITTNGASCTFHVPELKYSVHNGALFQCVANNSAGLLNQNFSLNILGKYIVWYIFLYEFRNSDELRVQMS